VVQSDRAEIFVEPVGPCESPLTLLHGGPGGAPAGQGWRGFFDPEAYRILGFHQRGCGNSRPLASDPAADLSVNTTSHLIADIEALRRLFDVERWTMLGLSWGTTLGLAYAESLRHLPIVDAYAELLADPDPSVRDRAAQEWVAWDHTQMGNSPPAKYDDPDIRLASARLVTHYWRNAGFLEDDQLLRDAGRLDGIPGAIVQGAHDVSCPPDMAWDLAKRWTTAELTIVDAGHGQSRTAPDAFPAAVTAALDGLSTI
jgi:proline iminopeptidase